MNSISRRGRGRSSVKKVTKTRSQIRRKHLQNGVRTYWCDAGLDYLSQKVRSFTFEGLGQQVGNFSLMLPKNSMNNYSYIQRQVSVCNHFISASNGIILSFFLIRVLFDHLTLFLSVDGGYSSWGTWSMCSRSCGVGSQQPSRTCTNPAPKYGGRTCYRQRWRLGRATERRSCATNVNCPGNKITISTFHGVLSERLESETCILPRRWTSVKYLPDQLGTKIPTWMRSRKFCGKP